MRGLERGDLSARAAPSPIDDKLADLTVAFNDMAASPEHAEDGRRRRETRRRLIPPGKLRSFTSRAGRGRG